VRGDTQRETDPGLDPAVLVLLMADAVSSDAVADAVKRAACGLRSSRWRREAEAPAASHGGEEDEAAHGPHWTT